MATKTKAGSAKGPPRSTTKKSQSSTSSKSKQKSGLKSYSTQHKPKPSLLTDKGKRKPPHLRYTEKELKVPQLNGIRPAGVQKPPNAKKGKTFVDDRAGMNAIMAMVMAEKEGNIESKMMRARHLEEVREARRIEMEKRAEGKRAKLEDRKRDIKNDGRKRTRVDGNPQTIGGRGAGDGESSRPRRKQVSFG